MMRKGLKRQLRISRYVIYKETLLDSKDLFFSFVGAFVGIGLIAFIQSKFLTDFENVFLIGSFGASAVLLYGATNSPLSQPRNLIGGHLVSSLIGVTIYKCLPDVIWLTAPLSVATSIVVMQITRTIHPPGGASALIAVIGTEKIKALGYWYILSPVLVGALILLVTALIFNNIIANRKQPNVIKRNYFNRKR